MEVPPERSNAPLEGLIVSPVGIYIISLEGFRLPKLSELSPDELNLLI